LSLSEKKGFWQNSNLRPQNGEKGGLRGKPGIKKKIAEEKKKMGGFRLCEKWVFEGGLFTSGRGRFLSALEGPGGKV